MGPRSIWEPFFPEPFTPTQKCGGTWTDMGTLGLVHYMPDSECDKSTVQWQPPDIQRVNSRGRCSKSSEYNRPRNHNSSYTTQPHDSAYARINSAVGDVCSTHPLWNSKNAALENQAVGFVWFLAPKCKKSSSGGHVWEHWLPVGPWEDCMNSAWPVCVLW